MDNGVRMDYGSRGRAGKWDERVKIGINVNSINNRTLLKNSILGAFLPFQNNHIRMFNVHYKVSKCSK